MQTTGKNGPITQGQFDAASADVLEKLRAGLSSNLSYHSVQHTVDVVENTRRLAQKENVPESEIYLLLTAALFHDTGFLNGYQNHERLSCDFARETLPGHGYTESAINRICDLIAVTKLPQAPTNLNERILCDADLYYLGSPHFFRDAEKLYKEWTAEGIVGSRLEWEAKQLAFLESHQYFTATAATEQNARKKAYLKQVRTQYKASQQKPRMSESATEVLHDAFYMVLGVLVAGF